MFTFTQWISSSIAVIISAFLVPGVILENIFIAIIVSLVIGIINTFLKPLIIILTLPINILSLGLFTFVINAVLILFAGAIVPGFFVSGFFSALIFSLILTFINSIVFKMIESSK